MAPAQGSYHKSAVARVRFGSWAEFARFIHQDGSSRGLFVKASAPAALDTDIDVLFGLPDGEEITLRGRVMQRLGADEAEAMGEHAGMGVQFALISDEQMQRIDQLLTNVAARQQRGSIPTASVNGNAAPVAAKPADPAVASAAAIKASAAMSGTPTRRIATGSSSAPSTRDEGSGAAKPTWLDTPQLQDPRLHQATSLLERGRFETAARHATDVLAEHPELLAAKILLLVIEARKLRSQFDFEHAIDAYHAVLALDAQHREASEQLSVLQKELEHSQALFERVFGRPRDV